MLLNVKVLQIIYNVNQAYVDSLKSDKDVIFVISEKDDSFEDFESESIFNDVSVFELELSQIK